MPRPVMLNNEVKHFYEDLQDLLELTPKRDVLFIIGDWNAKVWSQETPGVTGKFGLGVQNEVGQRLIEFWQENALVIANTLFQQHKRILYTWTSLDGQHRNQIDYIIYSQRRRSSMLLLLLSHFSRVWLCDSMNCSPPASSVQGILQARVMEWIAISFSNARKWKVKRKSLHHVWLFATPWITAFRLLCPWDFPGKSTGVGCHHLLQT